MRKPTLNFCIDSAALLAFVFLASTGALIYWVLPAGSGNLSIWGLTRHEWGEIHFWIAAGFVTLIGVHFILHWSWIVGMVKGKSKERNVSNTRILIGVVCVLLILSIALAPLFSPVSDSGEISGRSHYETELKK